MSRSVSAPSSVTNTSPCWNGLIVPGSTLRYGSNFWSWMRRPRALSRRPRDAATIPFPSAETTPPVTKTYFGARALTGFEGSRASGLCAGLQQVEEPAQRALRERPPHAPPGAVHGEDDPRPQGIERLELDLGVDPLVDQLEGEPAAGHDVRDDQG